MICSYQVSYLLNAWRATQSDQTQLQKSFVGKIKSNQQGEDCNRLIAAIENAVHKGNSILYSSAILEPNFRATLGDTSSLPCYISEDDTELKDLLRPLDALDLFGLLNDDGITVDYLNKMDLNDLKMIGIPSERAQKFHSDLQRLKRLHQKLENLKCVEIYDKLLKIGHTSDELWSMDHNVLKKAGLSFPDRKEVLNKMKSEKIKGNLYT